MSPYRQARETHLGLESPCRRCGANGHLYLYFPISVPAGPLCRGCFVTWRGLSDKMRFGTIGVGFCAWPIEDHTKIDHLYLYDNTITVDGPRPDEGPLQRPPLPPRWYEEAFSFVCDVVKSWACR